MSNISKKIIVGWIAFVIGVFTPLSNNFGEINAESNVVTTTTKKVEVTEQPTRNSTTEVVSSTTKGTVETTEGTTKKVVTTTEKATNTTTATTEKKVTEAKKDNSYELRCKITHYCACAKCCGKSDGITASGKKAKINHTIAVDRSVIPFGSKVIINGKEYIAEDCGVGGNTIDIFVSSHSEALEKGVYYTTVVVYPK